MLKKTFKIISTGSLIYFFSFSANAIELNLILSKEMITKNYGININYALYFPHSSVTQTIKGQEQRIFHRWLQAFNDENQGLISIISKIGEPSEISLGYRQIGEDKDFWPANCQKIPLIGVEKIKIILDTTGCTHSS